MHGPLRRAAAGVSLLELLVVVTILGVVAVLVVPRFSQQSTQAKHRSCAATKNNIEVQCELWRRQKGSAPRSDLSDVGANVSYFPEGLPKCPVDGSSYTLNTTTLTVNGHAH